MAPSKTPNKKITGTGKRRYNSYDPEKLKMAVEAYNSHKYGGYRKVAEKFGVAYSTLKDHVKCSTLKSIGTPRVLTDEVEKSLTDMIDQVASWDYPIGRTELKIIVKNILDKHQLKERRFQNNVPGDKWIRLFLNRNKLSVRIAKKHKTSKSIHK